MSYQCPDVFSVLWIPQANGMVSATTRKHITIGRKRYGLNDMSMSTECALRFPCFSIPQQNRLICTSTRQCLTIRAEGDR